MIEEYKANEFLIPFDNTRINESINEAKKYYRFSHYTTIEALEKILVNKCFKFNRLENVNDLIEKTQVSDKRYLNMIYISCFTHRVTEFIPHWYMYASGDKGVRITYELNENENFSEKLLETSTTFMYKREIVVRKRDVDEHVTVFSDTPDYIFSFRTNPIIYDNEFYKEHMLNGALNISDFGIAKRDDWSFEKETRIVSIIRIKRDCELDIGFDYILVPINLLNIKQITITYSPWMTDVDKEKVKAICDKNMSGAKYICRKSDLEKAIK